MGKIQKGTIFDLGDNMADITKHNDGSYTVKLMENAGSRPEVGQIDVGNRTMLEEVLSWFYNRKDY